MQSKGEILLFKVAILGKNNSSPPKIIKKKKNKTQKPKLNHHLTDQ